MSMTVDMGGVPELFKRIQKSEGYVRGQMVAANHFRSEINVYPPVRRGPAIFESHDELKAFFADLRAGKIEVPYVRGISPGSERLGQKWKVRRQAKRVIIKNDASYAAKVQGQAQHPYHKITGWKTVPTVLKSEAVVMLRLIFREVKKDLER